MQRRAKRQRVVLAGLEGLMHLSPPPRAETVSSPGQQSSLGPCETDTSDGGSIPSPPACTPCPPPPTTTRRAAAAVSNVSDGNYLYEVLPPGSRLGAEVLEQLRRDDDEVAEECLFLVRAYARHVCGATWRAVVDFFAQRGWRQVMATLHHAALQEAFLRHLCDSREWAGEEPVRRQVLLFLALVCPEAHPETLLREYAVDFLVAALHARDSATPHARTEDVSPTPVHWSQQCGKRTRRDVGARGVDDASAVAHAEARLSAIAGEALTRLDRTALVLTILVQLLLARNQYHDATPDMPPVALRFVQRGGLSAVLAWHGPSACERRILLTVLELLTASPALAHETGALTAMARWLLPRLCDGAQDDASCCVALLRVLTNVTNLHPRAFHGDDALDAELARCLRTLLRGPCEETDRVTYALCCAINLVKWEAKEQTGQFALAFLCDERVTDTAFCDELAARMLAAYAGDETDRLVLGGYYALLLATLSLITTPQQSLRLLVIRGVANAAAGSTLATRVTPQPMKMVVAIVQEFVLFQSSAGTLTTQHVVETQSILDAVVAANRIDVDDQ